MREKEKTCPRCRETKPAEEFHRNSRALDGRDYICAMCKREQGKAWNLANREKRKRLRKAWYQKHKTEHCARAERWRKAHPDRGRVYAARYREKKEQSA